MNIPEVSKESNGKYCAHFVTLDVSGPRSGSDRIGATERNRQSVISFVPRPLPGPGPKSRLGTRLVCHVVAAYAYGTPTEFAVSSP